MSYLVFEDNSEQGAISCSNGYGFVLGKLESGDIIREGVSIRIDGTIRGATYEFGGMYIRGDNGVYLRKNPFTETCSCPSGFTAKCAVGCVQNDMLNYTA